MSAEVQELPEFPREFVAEARRLRIDLAYDGTDFAGWQFQPGQRTVQGVIEAALARLQGGGSVSLRGAGRTDAGVHARGQVADVVVRTDLDDDAIEYSLRRMLPDDLRPLRVRTSDPGFHARRQALSKTYRYRVDLSPYGDPFGRRFALHAPWPLDLARIETALGGLPGRRDWSGFAAAKCRVKSRVRELSAARLELELPGELALVFTADGFLHHMVRNLVGTLLAIGRGQLDPQTIERALTTGDRRLAGPTAPAKGLSLERVDYPSSVEPPADPH